jgi:hypothetical protein
MTLELIYSFFILTGFVIIGDLPPPSDEKRHPDDS